MSLTNKVTDRDCINLSELVYQNIRGFEGGMLKDHFYDSHNNVKLEIKRKFPEYAKSLATFPGYYIPTFEKYTLLEVSHSVSGYYGGAFRNTKTNEIVLANRGTVVDLKEKTQTIEDLIADIKLGFLGKADEQFADANNFYKIIINKPEYTSNCSGIVLTGHSLGGAQAITQFVSFYEPGGILKKLITLEAPGMRNVFENKNILGNKNVSTPGDDVAGFAATKGLVLTPEKKDEINDASPIFQFNKLLHEKYSSMVSQFFSVAIQYGTNADLIYNGLPHIGKTINPLSKDGQFVHIKNLQYVKERGFPIDVFHSIATYKIYALNDNDDVVPGMIELRNFLRFVLPLLRELQLNNDEIMQFLGRMYTYGFRTYDNLESFVLKNFKGNAGYLVGGPSGKLMFEQRYKDILTEFYRYSVLFGFLRGNLWEDTLTTTAKYMLENSFDGLSLLPEKSEAQKALEFEQKVLSFEHRYRIHDLRKVKSIMEIPDQALSPRNPDELEVLEYIFEYLSNNAGKIQEETRVWASFNRYEKFCKEHKNFISRAQEIDSLLFLLKSRVEHCYI